MTLSDAMIPPSYEHNFSNCFEKPEKFKASMGFAKIAFITAKIIVSFYCPLIVRLNNNGAPLQKA